MKGKGTPHKAKPSKGGRAKFWRNYPGRRKVGDSKYVLRMKAQGTFKVRKSRSK